MADLERGYDGVQYADISGKPSRSAKICRYIGQFCKANLLVILLLTSMVLGIVIGFIVKFSSDRVYSKKEIGYISFPGVLFLNCLKMMIIPLITTSLISGMASLDKTAYGKLGGKAILYYMTTTFLAVIVGIVLVVSIQPGKGRDKDDINRKEDYRTEQVDTVDAFLDLIR